MYICICSPYIYIIHIYIYICTYMFLMSKLLISALVSLALVQVLRAVGQSLAICGFLVIPCKDMTATSGAMCSPGTWTLKVPIIMVSMAAMFVDSLERLRHTKLNSVPNWTQQKALQLLAAKYEWTC